MSDAPSQAPEMSRGQAHADAIHLLKYMVPIGVYSVQERQVNLGGTSALRRLEGPASQDQQNVDDDMPRDSCTLSGSFAG